MNEMIEKLKAILTALEVEPEKIEAAIAALTEQAAPVEPAVEGEGEEPSTSEEPPVVPEELPEPPAEEPVEEEPVEIPQEEVPADPASVPPEPAEEPVPPVEEPVNPAEEPIPPAPSPALPELPPMVSLEEFEAVKNDLAETKKALDGVKAQNEALLEALKNAGVISGPISSQVGEEGPSLPDTKNSDTTMDDVLREINTKRY